MRSTLDKANKAKTAAEKRVADIRRLVSVSNNPSTFVLSWLRPNDLTTMYINVHEQSQRQENDGRKAAATKIAILQQHNSNLSTQVRTHQTTIDKLKVHLC